MARAARPYNLRPDDSAGHPQYGFFSNSQFEMRNEQ
jgi:hypothetical protein